MTDEAGQETTSEETDPIAAAVEAAEPVGEAPAETSSTRSTPVPPDDDEPPAYGEKIDWDDCLVTPLGVGYGGVFYFLGPMGELREMGAGALGTGAGQAGLFLGRSAWLKDYFPKKKRERDNWRVADVRDRLMEKCADKNQLFDPSRSVRGPGSWRGADGGLVVHCGNKLLVGGERRAAGVQIDGFIYPAGPPVMAPADKQATVEECQAILKLFGEWTWRAPETSPRLLLGVVGEGYLTGALDWRSHGWIVGAKHTGKSTLQKFIKDLLGALLLKGFAPSEAGVRQVLGRDYSARPIELDEMEPEPGTRKIHDLLALARIASDAGETFRGSAGGDAQIYKLNASLLFGSIKHPRFLPQDQERICVFALDALEADAEKRSRFRAAIKKQSAIGPALFRRLVDGWDRVQANIEVFRMALSRAQYGARVADQYGTLLAIAETLLSDVVATADKADALVADVGLRDMVERDSEDSPELCVQKLMSSKTDIRAEAGRAKTVGELVGDALEGDFPDCRRLLVNLGLKLVVAKPSGGWQAWDGKGDRRLVGLAVANNHEFLMRIFEGTDWERGVWPQDLRSAAGGGSNTKPMKFGTGVVQRAVVLPGSIFDADPDESTADAGAAASDQIDGGIDG